MKPFEYHLSYRLSRGTNKAYYGSTTLTLGQPISPDILEYHSLKLLEYLQGTLPDATGIIILSFSEFPRNTEACT